MIDVVMAGAQKAGTTSLHRILGSYLDIYTHEHLDDYPNWKKTRQEFYASEC